MMQLGLAYVPTKASCTVGVCRPLDAATRAKFTALQTEINRVRGLYKLSKDLVIDGIIGPSTVASLIRLATVIPASERVGSLVPFVLTSGTLPSTQTVVDRVDSLTSALRYYKTSTPAPIPSGLPPGVPVPPNVDFPSMPAPPVIVPSAGTQQTIVYTPEGQAAYDYVQQVKQALQARQNTWVGIALGSGVILVGALLFAATK